MTKRRLIGWIAFYFLIAITILVVYLFLQERYAHNYSQEGRNTPPDAAFTMTHLLAPPEL